MTIARRGLLSGFLAGGAAASLPARAEEAVGTPLVPVANACRLTSQAVEGPFYLDPRLERADIREDRDGVPLELALLVLDGSSCAPLPGTRIDVWHADAQGLYSGYAGQGDDHNLDMRQAHFMRGTQHADSQGWVRFKSIYPGWYTGRTPHIHFKGFVADNEVITGQIFFPDALSEFIYEHVHAYDRGQRRRDTANGTDNVMAAMTNPYTSFAVVKEEKDRYLATLVLAVDRMAQPAASGQRPPPPPPGFGPPGGGRAATHMLPVQQLVPGLGQR